MSPKQIVHGATGLAKVGLQMAGVAVDACPESETLRRRHLCRECPHATRSADPRFAANKGLTTRSQCGVCQCVIAAKTRLASESCPRGKWRAWRVK